MRADTFAGVLPGDDRLHGGNLPHLQLASGASCS